MEIIVEGSSSQSFKPDEVIMYVNFSINSKTYEEVLEKGNLSVQLFVDELNSLGLDVKTDNFTIVEDKKYNNETKEYDFIGYIYNQNSNLVFDYDVNLINKIMKNLSNLNYVPTYSFDFRLKDENKYRDMVLDSCYEDALKQASSIALKFNKELKECLKADFKFYNNNIRLTNYSEVINHVVNINGVLYTTWETK